MCDDTGTTTYITLLKCPEEAAKKLSDKFLKEQFDLKSFKPAERKRLQAAFEQGAVVMSNCVDAV